jgi:hypothetical protein
MDVRSGSSTASSYTSRGQCRARDRAAYAEESPLVRKITPIQQVLSVGGSRVHVELVS